MNTLIRITLIRTETTTGDGRTNPAKTIVHDFTDVALAQKFFVEDSYFAEGYTTKATWERIAL